MNWQLISFFGDSTVLLPSAAALFIVLMLRKTSRLLAWQWSLLFGITGAIVCAEEHNIYGGLGSAVSEVLAYEGCGVPTEFVGIQDTFTESAPYKELLAKYGVDANGVIEGIEKVLDRK